MRSVNTPSISNSWINKSINGFVLINNCWNSWTIIYPVMWTFQDGWKSATLLKYRFNTERKMKEATNATFYFIGFHSNFLFCFVLFWFLLEFLAAGQLLLRWIFSLETTGGHFVLGKKKLRNFLSLFFSCFFFASTRLTWLFFSSSSWWKSLETSRLSHHFINFYSTFQMPQNGTRRHFVSPPTPPTRQQIHHEIQIHPSDLFTDWIIDSNCTKRPMISIVPQRFQ